MLSPVVCLAARGVIRDATTNQISVFNILESATGGGVPLLVPELSVLVIWRKGPTDPESYKLTFRVANNATKLIEGALNIDFGGTRLHRSLIGIAGLVLQEPGALRFSVSEGMKEVAMYEVPVEIAASAKTTSASADA